MPERSVAEHRPEVAVLSCSDARVPPSHVFDRPAGALFVVRIAGNTASPEARASLDYAVGELGVSEVVVLGHTHCGAVAAAAAGTCGGHLEPIVRPICELARRNPAADAAELERLNVLATAHTLRQHDGPVGEAACSARLRIRAMVFDLESGRLDELAVPHANGQPIAQPFIRPGNQPLNQPLNQPGNQPLKQPLETT